MRLSMRNITKRFGPTLANDDISLDLEAGEIHALLGENGAGKSTLMKILAGLIQADGGGMEIGGQPFHIQSPRDALKAGIAIVSQHPLVALRLTVFENLFAGLPPDQRIYRNKRAAWKHLESLFEICNFNVDLKDLAEELPLSKQKQIEIVRALGRNARLLIFDEPTDVFTPVESKEFFQLVNRLAGEGRAIVLITHVLEEALEHSSRVTVLKKGRVAGRFRSTETTVPELAGVMIGELPSQKHAARPPHRGGTPLLAVTDVRIKESHGRETVRGVTLDVYPGEVVGLAGVAGNGQESLMEAIVGLQSIIAGAIKIDGRAVVGGDTRKLITSNRIGYIPPDRTRDGIVGPMSVADNLVTDVLERPPWSQFGVRNVAWASGWARDLVVKYGVRPASPKLPIAGLSGGNQQKVILARVLDRKPRLLVVANPTRGLDIGASQWVWATLRTLRDEGCAVLMLSGDVEELRQLADRILVFFRGTISGELAPHDATSERLGLLMGGAKQANAA
jgi:general nucleoside transport system ATP-binding protein